MDREKLVKKTLYFGEEEYEKLSKYAKEHKMKPSKIIRMLIKEFNGAILETQNKDEISNFSIETIIYTNSAKKSLKSTLNEK